MSMYVKFKLKKNILRASAHYMTRQKSRFTFKILHTVLIQCTISPTVDMKTLFLKIFFVCLTWFIYRIYIHFLM